MKLNRKRVMTCLAPQIVVDGKNYIQEHLFLRWQEFQKKKVNFFSVPRRADTLAICHHNILRAFSANYHYKKLSFVISITAFDLHRKIQSAHDNDRLNTVSKSNKIIIRYRRIDSYRHLVSRRRDTGHSCLKNCHHQQQTNNTHTHERNKI